MILIFINRKNLFYVLKGIFFPILMKYVIIIHIIIIKNMK